VNYLAHFHLAQADDDWIVGALLGDFVKGPLRGAWPAGWERGMRLHRHIDAYSDSHPLRRDAARALPAHYRRYAGIVLDVCDDYWLSRHWSHFHAEPLPRFAARVYGVLAQYRQQLPAPAARMATRLIDHDVLGIFDRWSTVAATLERIGTRLRRANPLATAGAELPAYLPSLEQNFLSFYPDLIQRVRNPAFERHESPLY
jgi:acyl carrier protein phosphodiesterase